MARSKVRLQQEPAVRFFANLALAAGNKIVLYDEVNGTTCMTRSVDYTVSCYVQQPTITAANNQLKVGNAITGTSSKAAGTAIKLYDAAAPATPLATVTVQPDGTWSSGINAVAGKNYYAVASTSCGSSANSATVSAAAANATVRCGTVTMPVLETATTVSGTLSGNPVTGTVVRLFLDGYQTGSAITGTNAWSVTSITANTLYPGGILSIDVQEPNRLVETCPVVATNMVSCVTPSNPAVAPVTVVVSAGTGKTVFTITGSQSGILYRWKIWPEPIKVFPYLATVALLQ
jgi:hypothetical protein